MTAPAPDGSGLALTFRDLTIGYDRHPAVHHLHGSVGRGESLAIVGPNGAGKSTLLKAIVGEAALLDGAIDRHGSQIRDIAYLPQLAEIDRAFPINVFDFVATGLWRRLGGWRRLGAGDRAAVADALNRVALEGFEARPIGALSGGQMQRALLARTIVQACDLILLDEPFAAIDERASADLFEILAGWRREGRTVLAAMHDLSHVRQLFPRTLLLARDPIAWGPTDKVLTPDHLARTRRLTEAWDENSRACEGPAHRHDRAAGR